MCIFVQETQELLAAVKQKRAAQPNTNEVVIKKEPGVPATVTNIVKQVQIFVSIYEMNISLYNSPIMFFFLIYNYIYIYIYV